MPTYCYECVKCGQLEVEQPITEAALKVCPECGGSSGFKKLIAPVAVMFKGSGFHINDYSSAPKEAECSGQPGNCGACSTEAKG